MTCAELVVVDDQHADRFHELLDVPQRSRSHGEHPATEAGRGTKPLRAYTWVKGAGAIARNVPMPRQGTAVNVRAHASCQPVHLRARVAASIAGSKRRSSRQDAAKPAGSGQPRRPVRPDRRRRAQSSPSRAAGRQARPECRKELHGHVRSRSCRRPRAARWRRQTHPASRPPSPR